MKEQREAGMPEGEARPVEAPSAAAPVSAPDYSMEPAPAPTPKIEYRQRVEIQREETPRAEAPRVETPRIDPKEILSNAGLQMVETTRAPAPMPEPEPERLGRPRRDKPAAAPSGQDELVQVETRDK